MAYMPGPPMAANGAEATGPTVTQRRRMGCAAEQQHDLAEALTAVLMGVGRRTRTPARRWRPPKRRRQPWQCQNGDAPAQRANARHNEPKNNDEEHTKVNSAAREEADDGIYAAIQAVRDMVTSLRSDMHEHGRKLDEVLTAIQRDRTLRIKLEFDSIVPAIKQEVSKGDAMLSEIGGALPLRQVTSKEVDTCSPAALDTSGIFDIAQGSIQAGQEEEVNKEPSETDESAIRLGASSVDEEPGGGAGTLGRQEPFKQIDAEVSNGKGTTQDEASKVNEALGENDGDFGTGQPPDQHAGGTGSQQELPNQTGCSEVEGEDPMSWREICQGFCASEEGRQELRDFLLGVIDEG